MISDQTSLHSIQLPLLTSKSEGGAARGTSSVEHDSSIEHYYEVNIINSFFFFRISGG